MPNNAGNVVVAGDGTAYVGPITTPAPTNAATALNAGFLEMGFITEDGATLTQGQELTDINAWQSFYPIRRIVTGRTVQVAFSMREFNKRAVEFATGGTITTNAAEWKLTPPGPSTDTRKSLVLEWLDGSKKYRLYVPVGLVAEDVESTMARTDSVNLPIVFAASDPGTGSSIYTLFTTDVAFSS